MKKILTLSFVLLSNLLYAQIDIDSLIIELFDVKKFEKADGVYWFFEKFQRYKSLDGRETYDVYFDSLGKLSENIGVSVVYNQFDKEGRNIKRIGYDKMGKYNLWDFEPIVIICYSKNTIKETRYDYRNVLRVAITKDSVGREIESINYDKNGKFILRIVYEYSDSLTITKYLDEKGKFKPDQLGVSIKVEKTVLTGKYIIKEEYFYDSERRFVDANHKGFTSFDLKYSLVKTLMENGRVSEQKYYNSKGTKVLECIFMGIVS